MVEEHVPLPPVGGPPRRGFVFSQPSYAPVSNDSPMFAIDCEMCMTAANESELTSVSVVDEDHNVVLHSLVMPRSPIVNYLTRYSGG
jgi:RNA exonuclease 1